MRCMMNGYLEEAKTPSGGIDDFGQLPSSCPISDVSTASKSVLAVQFALESAAKSGDVSACEEILSTWATNNENIEPLLKSQNLSTILRVLAAVPPHDSDFVQSRVEVARLLVEFAASLDARSAKYQSVLQLAMESAIEVLRVPTKAQSRLGLVQFLLHTKADANHAVNEDEDTLLMQAAHAGDYHLCEMLLECSADIDRANILGLVASDFADDHPHVQGLLLQWERRVSKPNGFMPSEAQTVDLATLNLPEITAALDEVQNALRKSRLDEYSVAIGAERDDSISNFQAAVNAASADMDSKNAWLRCGAALVSRNTEGELLLQLCGTPSPMGKTADAAKWMIEYRACLTVTDECGDSPLHLAVKAAAQGWPASKTVVRALLDAMIDPNVCNEQGDTPLWAAAQSGSDIVFWLLDAGAEFCAKPD